MLLAARIPAGVLFAALLAASAPIAQAICQDGVSGNIKELQLDEAGA